MVLALSPTFAAFGSPLTTAWTYQGQLRRSGSAYNGTCDFQFSLWDSASAGTQKVGTQSINGVSVVNGLFTVTLDLQGTSPIGEVLGFAGEARWLATSVQCSGDSGFTPLDPRQGITATPYALSLRPGATSIGDGTGAGLKVVNTNIGSTTAGISGTGAIGVDGQASIPGGRGVRGVATEANSAGVFGYNIQGRAIWGQSIGSGSAIYGENYGGGLAGDFKGPVDIQGSLETVVTSGATAILGKGGTGVYGMTESPAGVGVYGQAGLPDSAGVYGINRDSAAIWGKSTGNGSAIFGENTGSGYAGRFAGSVLVEGNLVVAGTLFKNAGAFRVDHPLDPEHKFLSHSFVESPDMKNIYDGTVTTDATGSATVALPDYFAALNRDYRYQLTVVGQFAQAIVSREIIADNTFAIRTDKPGVKVSWQVTGIRQDAYAQANPIVVEEPKPAEEQGMYLFPAGFGAGEEKRIGHLSQPALKPGAQEPQAVGPGDQSSR
jgi:hypothetical protein